jgi:hypothetical protein
MGFLMEFTVAGLFGTSGPLSQIGATGPKPPLVSNPSNGRFQSKADMPLRHLGRFAALRGTNQKSLQCWARKTLALVVPMVAFNEVFLSKASGSTVPLAFVTVTELDDLNYIFRQWFSTNLLFYFP